MDSFSLKLPRSGNVAFGIQGTRCLQSSDAEEQLDSVVSDTPHLSQYSQKVDATLNVAVVQQAARSCPNPPSCSGEERLKWGAVGYLLDSDSTRLNRFAEVR